VRPHVGAANSHYTLTYTFKARIGYLYTSPGSDQVRQLGMR